MGSGDSARWGIPDPYTLLDFPSLLARNRRRPPASRGKCDTGLVIRKTHFGFYAIVYFRRALAKGPNIPRTSERFQALPAYRWLVEVFISTSITCQLTEVL